MSASAFKVVGARKHPHRKKALQHGERSGFNVLAGCAFYGVGNCWWDTLWLFNLLLVTFLIKVMSCCFPYLISCLISTHLVFCSRPHAPLVFHVRPVLTELTWVSFCPCSVFSLFFLPHIASCSSAAALVLSVPEFDSPSDWSCRLNLSPRICLPSLISFWFLISCVPNPAYLSKDMLFDSLLRPQGLTGTVVGLCLHKMIKWLNIVKIITI